MSGMYITRNFSYEELTASQEAVRRGIFNEVPDELWGNLHFLAEQLQIVRAILDNKTILVSSGYRCPELNKAIGGAKDSAHMKCLAADFTCPRFGTPYQIIETIVRASGFEFDQLIHEFGRWVHIGFSESTPRKQVLTAVRDPERNATRYIPGLLRVTTNGLLLPSGVQP